jgi:hypothetical protein
MGQYWRENKSYIQSDLAYRLGKIILQYDAAYPIASESNFNSSLYLASLQTLLTTCNELIHKNDFEFPFRDSFYNILTQIDKRNQFGLNGEMIIENTFSRGIPKCSVFLNHLRNAMSHPTITNHESENASSGYTSINEGAIITKYLFVNRSHDFPHKVFKIVLTVEELRLLTLALSKFLAQPYQLRWNVSWNGDSFDNNILEHAA